jgi:hypothetical protein
MNRTVAAAAALMVMLAPSVAQTPQPYSGLQSRPLKALSESQIADLRAGRGMGLALAAELNGYPGPIHVLELADQLGLSPQQRARVRALYEAMKAEAIPLGERWIAQETLLDELFAGRSVTSATLAQATAAIGETQAALRLAHLKYHVVTIEVLAPNQVAHYAELRGYADDSAGHHARPQHHPK